MKIPLKTQDILSITVMILLIQVRPDPERIGLKRGDGGSQWGVLQIAKAHFENHAKRSFIGIQADKHCLSIKYILLWGF